MLTINIESHIKDRRSYHRRRRNVIRRFFLILFVAIYLIFAIKIFLIPTYKPLKIEVINNLLIQTNYITHVVLDQVDSKNFFLISPNKISNYLLNTTDLIKNVVVRKYTMPECKLIVYVKEKDVWAEMLLDNFRNKKRYFITCEGDLIPIDYVNLSVLPQNLITIYSNFGIVPSSSDLCDLKRIFDLICFGMHLKVSNFFLDDQGYLEIFLGDGLKIKAGKMDGDLLKRVSQLKEALGAIRGRSYKAEYLDLTLESGAVFKRLSIDRKKAGIFRRKKTQD